MLEPTPVAGNILGEAEKKTDEMISSLDTVAVPPAPTSIEKKPEAETSLMQQTENLLQDTSKDKEAESLEESVDLPLVEEKEEPTQPSIFDKLDPNLTGFQRIEAVRKLDYTYNRMVDKERQDRYNSINLLNLAEDRLNDNTSSLKALDDIEDRLDAAEDSSSIAGEIFSAIGDFTYGLVGRGLAKAAGNTIDTIEDAINYTFDSDINIADIELDPASSTAEEVGTIIGTEIPAIVTGYLAAAGLTATGAGAPAGVVQAAVTTARVSRLSQALLRVGGAVKRTAPALLAFEGTYAGVSQFTHRPDEVLLQDFFIDNPGVDKDSVNQYLEGNITDPDSLRRLKMATESVAIGAGFSALFMAVGKGLSRFRDPKYVKSLAKDLTGQGDSLLSQRQRVEEYLVSVAGYSPKAAIARVRDHMDSGASLNTLVRQAEVDKIIMNDPAALKRITARNVLETTGQRSSDEALEYVARLEKVGKLDDTISKIAGAEPVDFLAQAAAKSEKLVRDAEAKSASLLEKTVKEDESVLIGRKMESVKVGAYDAATLDGIMQDALTGIGGNATKIWKVFEETGKKTDFFTDPSQSPYILKSLQMQRSQAHANNFILPGKKFSPVVPGAAGKVSKTSALSLGNISEKYGWKTPDMDKFLSYVRAEKQLVDWNKKVPIPSKLKPEQLKVIVDEGRANPKYVEALADYGALQKSILDYSVASGTISREEASSMIAAALNEDGMYVYIPRNVAEGQLEGLAKKATGSVRSSTGYKGLVGTTKELRDPYLDVVEDITSKIYKGQANITKAARYKMIERAKRVGTPKVKELAERLTKEVDLGKQVAIDGGIVSGLREHLKALTALNKSIVIDTEKARTLLKSSLDDLEFNDLLEVAGENIQFKAAGTNKTYDIFFDKGVRRMVEVTDPALARMVESEGARKSLESGFLNNVLNTTAGLTRTYSSFITKTPWFAAKSIIRDGYFAEMISPIGLLPKFRAIRGLFALAANPKLIKEMREAGWSGGTQILEIQKGWKNANALRAAGDTAENINKAERQSFLRGLASGSVTKWTNFVNNSEMASRVGEYIVAKNAGASDDFAVFMGQETLVNFGKTGTSSAWRTFTDHQVFFRPTYLGMAKTGEAIKNNPVKSALYLTSMATVINASEAISSLYPEYKTKSEQDKNLWTYFPNVDAGELLAWTQGGMVGSPPALDRETPWLTVPAVHELQALSRGMQKTYSLLKGQGYNGTTMSMITELGEGLTPMLSSLLVTPTLLSPLVELATNRSSYDGQSILRQSQQVPFNKELVVSPSTGEFGKRLSEWSKAVDAFVVGGTGDAWFTPIAADYFLNQYFVGFASYAKNMLDEAGRESIKGEVPKSFFGDNSKSADLFTYMGQNMGNVFFDSPAAGRALETFAYEMSNLVNGLDFKDKAVRKEFISTLGNATVTDYTGGEIKLKKVSRLSRKVIEILSRINTNKSIIKNLTDMSGDEKRAQLLLLEEQETHLLLQYQRGIQQFDPKKTIQALRD